MVTKQRFYLFIDESGDPGKPFKIDPSGNKIKTGASAYYIVSVLAMDNLKMYAIEDEILALKNKYSYFKEIKSTEISLPFYKDLLSLINKYNINIYYRCIDKFKYKGIFAVDGSKKLNNVFDEYNLAKLIDFSLRSEGYLNTEVVIDRADRRAHNQSFDGFNSYVFSKCNSKTIKRSNCITHVCSEYVNIMQLADLVSGAIKDNFTKKNTDLKKVIDKSRMKKCI